MIIKLVNESVFYICIPAAGEPNWVQKYPLTKAISDFWGISRTFLKEVSQSGYFCREKQIVIIYPAESKTKSTIWVYFNHKAPSGTHFKGISCFIFKKAPHQQT